MNHMNLTAGITMYKPFTGPALRRSRLERAERAARNCPWSQRPWRPQVHSDDLGILAFLEPPKMCTNTHRIIGISQMPTLHHLQNLYIDICRARERERERDKKERCLCMHKQEHEISHHMSSHISTNINRLFSWVMGHGFHSKVSNSQRLVHIDPMINHYKSISTISTDGS